MMRSIYKTSLEAHYIIQWQGMLNEKKTFLDLRYPKLCFVYGFVNDFYLTSGLIIIREGY